MAELELTPDPHLLESMRAVGYSFETAVADIIDNSIAAGAETIHLLTSPSGPPRVSLFDDGCGMDRPTAIEAMKLAARSPNDERTETDLGRFGLGLKTASLSQCRRLTVATKRDGALTILCWDLDHVAKTKRWLLLELSSVDARALYGWDLLAQARHGTLVSWEQLDRLRDTEGPTQADFDAAVHRVKSHCELVFHRFVSGLGVPRIRLTINGNRLEELDPFLRKHRATQRREEPLQVGHQTLSVQAFTLPFINKLSGADKRKAMAPGSFRDSQGFYIYRGGRLVVWGTWFRLNAKSEAGKLARVQVDVPNNLDHLWALDIKKSVATPPRELREALKQFAGQFVTPSSKIHKFRGRKPKDLDQVIRFWDVILDREGAFRYEINRKHPMVDRFVDTLDPSQLSALEGIFEMLERSFPILDAHNRLSDDRSAMTSDGGVAEAVERALALRPMFAGTFSSEDEYLQFLLGMEPFNESEGFETAYREAVQALE